MVKSREILRTQMKPDLSLPNRQGHTGHRGDRGVLRRFNRSSSTSCRRRASFMAFNGQCPAASPTIDRVCHLGAGVDLACRLIDLLFSRCSDAALQFFVGSYECPLLENSCLMLKIKVFLSVEHRCWHSLLFHHRVMQTGRKSQPPFARLIYERNSKKPAIQKSS